jgi:poly-beta-1,6-N-acetyl-D-glucosamine biosynthesis protein PgaD
VRPSVIIDARRQLSWNRRLFSDASTLALWSFWLWLCRSAVVRMMGMLGVMLGISHSGKHAATPLMLAGMYTLEDAALALVGTGTLLMLWNRLASQPAPTPSIQAVPDYVAYFGVEAPMLDVARESQVCVVHHDESGRILRIEARQVSPADGGALRT